MYGILPCSFVGDDIEKGRRIPRDNIEKRKAATRMAKKKAEPEDSAFFLVKYILMELLVLVFEFLVEVAEDIAEGGLLEIVLDLN